MSEHVTVEVGQVWEMDRKGKRARFTVREIIGSCGHDPCRRHARWTHEDRSPNGICTHAMTAPEGGYYNFALVSPAHQPAHVTPDKPSRATMRVVRCGGPCDVVVWDFRGVVSGSRTYCSEACASKPPVGVPAGTWNAPCPGGCGGGAWGDGGPCANCAPAPAATPAKAKFIDPTDVAYVCGELPPSAPPIFIQPEHNPSRAFLEWSHRQSGVSMMARLPERIEKPRMAHVANSDWEWLGDV